MEFTSGNDIIPLKTPGKKWYICGAPNHCANGNQKLAITVFGGQSPAPSPTSAARISVAPVYYGWMVAFFSTLRWSWFDIGISKGMFGTECGLQNVL